MTSEQLYRFADRHQVPLVASFILLAGFSLGLVLDANANIPQPWNRVSSIIGWVYFFCWAVGFYPQIVLNFRRKSVEGYSLDSALLAILGFGGYAIFNAAFYYSTSVQELYMARHDGNRNTVELNDVIFSIHATTMVAITITQCAIYPAGRQHVSRATKLIAWSTLAATVAYVAGIALADRVTWLEALTVLDLLYFFSYVKLVSNLVKELPQLLLNYKRKATIGWTVWGVLLDIPGCLLSITQQVLDSWATSDWSAITGNPVKFGLAFLSLTTSTLFVLQHYYWFADNNKLLELENAERTPLLASAKPTAANGSTTHKPHGPWLVHVKADDQHAVENAHWEITAEPARG